MVRTLTGPAFLTFGLVVGWVGYALWRSPHLDWDLFVDSGLNAVLWVWDEVYRMVQDPLSWVGLLVMLVGVGVLLVGMRKVRYLIFGR